MNHKTTWQDIPIHTGEILGDNKILSIHFFMYIFMYFFTENQYSQVRKYRRCSHSAHIRGTEDMSGPS